MKHMERGIATLGFCGLTAVMAWVKIDGLAWIIPFFCLLFIWSDASKEN